MDVSSFWLPGPLIHTLRLTIGVGQPTVFAMWQLTEFFPFFPLVMIAEWALNLSLLLRALLRARTMQYPHWQSAWCILSCGIRGIRGVSFWSSRDGADVAGGDVGVFVVVDVVKLSVRRLAIRTEVLLVYAAPIPMGVSSTTVSGASGGRS